MKKIASVFLFVGFALLISQFSFGQKNYLPGSIISLNGDTLKGFIDYRNWEKNPDNIHFSKSAEGEAEIFTPIEISEFIVLDEIYVGAIVKAEVSPFVTNDLQYDPEFQFETDTIFLQTIFRGAKSLYYYKNRVGNENFYFEHNNEIIHLDYKRYLKEQVNENVIAENKRYIGQLAVYLGDCPSIQSKLKNTKYNKESLEKLYLYYYDCTKQDVEFERTVEKARIEKSILAGMTLSTINFKSDYYDYSDHYNYLVNVDYPMSVNFTLGISLDVVLPRNRGRWSLCNDIIFSSFKTEGTYTDYEHGNKYTITNTEIGFSYLKIYSQGRYRYPIKKFLVYMNAGLSFGFSLTEVNSKRSEIKFYNTERVVVDKAIDDYMKLNFGFLAGVGTMYKRFSFEFRYEKASIESGQPNWYFFLFGYQFGKKK